MGPTVFFTADVLIPRRLPLLHSSLAETGVTCLTQDSKEFCGNQHDDVGVKSAMRKNGRDLMGAGVILRRYTVPDWT